MAKSLQRIRGFFQRKPFRLFSLILLYFFAGSLAFLYSGFNTDDELGSERSSNSQLPSAVRGQVYLSDARGFVTVRRVFEERRTERRYITPWMKRTTERGSDGGQKGSALSRTTKERTSNDADDEKGKFYLSRYIFNMWQIVNYERFFQFSTEVVTECGLVPIALLRSNVNLVDSPESFVITH